MSYRRFRMSELKQIKDPSNIRKSHRELAALMNRDPCTIARWRKRLGLDAPRPNLWSKEDEDILRDNIGRLTYAEIGRLVGRGKRTVQSKSTRMGINPGDTRNYWTKKEDNFLNQHYKSFTKLQLAHKLGRSVSAVNNRAAKLNLRKYG